MEIVFFPVITSQAFHVPLSELKQRGLSGLTEDELEDLYTIPFFIWTNYESTEVELPVTSINYLSTLALERAGIELPAYNQFLADMMETIPAINSRAIIQSLRRISIEATGEEADWIRNYNILQYNNMFDKKRKEYILSLSEIVSESNRDQNLQWTMCVRRNVEEKNGESDTWKNRDYCQ